MLKVGLTGGVACGKSTVGEMFVARGAHVIQADRIAHELMQPGTSVYADIVRCFGRGILNPDQTISRERLAQAAFGDERVAELNAIVHPAVILAQERWMEQVAAGDPAGVAIVEAALILEAGAAKRFDKLVVVTCTPEQKVLRFAARHSIPTETARAEVERRSRAQLPDAEKVRAADYVVDNSASPDETAACVERVWTELERISRTNYESRTCEHGSP